MDAFSCKHCPRGFASQQGLNSHQQVHKERARTDKLAPKRKRLLRAATRLGLDKGSLNGRVPAVVCRHLGGSTGDCVVFEEGSFAAAERAAIHGPYVILRIDRSHPLHAQVQQANAQPQVEAAPPVESIAEQVKKKIETRRGSAEKTL